MFFIHHNLGFPGKSTQLLRCKREYHLKNLVYEDKKSSKRMEGKGSISLTGSGTDCAGSAGTSGVSMAEGEPVKGSLLLTLVPSIAFFLALRI